MTAATVTSVGAPADAGRGIRIGTACAIGAAVLFGTSWSITGVALRGFDPFVAAFWRSIVTVAVLLPLLLWNNRRRIDARRGRDQAALAGAIDTVPRPRRGRLLRLVVLGTMGGAIFGVGMNVSVQLTGAAITAFIAGAYPVVAAAVAPLLLPEQPSRAAAAGLVLALVGSLLVAGFDVAGLRIEGLLVGATTALVIGVYLPLVRRWARAWHLGTLELALANFVMLGVASSIAVVVTGERLVPASASLESWLAAIYLGLVAGGTANLLLAEGLRRLPSSESSAYLMLNPLTGAVLAVPILGEVLSTPQLLGGALVIGGVALSTGGAALVVRRIRRLRRLEAAPTMDAP